MEEDYKCSKDQNITTEDLDHLARVLSPRESILRGDINYLLEEKYGSLENAQSSIFDHCSGCSSCGSYFGDRFKFYTMLGKYPETEPAPVGFGTKVLQASREAAKKFRKD